LGEGPLTILAVRETFANIAATEGRDSTAKRRRLLEALLGRAAETDRRWLLGAMFGEMRIGASEGVMLEAIADASGVEAARVRKANQFAGDLGRVATAALTGGEAALQQFTLTLFTPVKPMTAEMGEDAETILEEHGGRTAVEFKLDGARIQIHRQGDTVRVFTRRLTEVTESLPEIVEIARSLPARSFLAEGEVVAVDARSRPLPFQDLMRRFRRVHDVEALRREIPLQLYLFDLLSQDGRLLIEEPYAARWRALEALAPADLLTPRKVAEDRETIDTFFREALAAGHEGLMAKALDSDYAVGKRGKKWFKLKPAETLDCVILAAEWGHGRRQGTLSNYHLGVRDGDGWQMIGKTFKGLTDAERATMTERLQELTTEDRGGYVVVRPEIVVEIAHNEIQKSPQYPSGYALRFARITRIRDDKAAAQADTYEGLEARYQRQFVAKGRLPGG
jgi:DNA ligase-1